MRLFVALDIPQAVRDSLTAVRARFEKVCPGARWVRIEGAHVTLKFIGEVAAEQAEPIRAAVRAIHLDSDAFDAHSPGSIELRFASLGFFPDDRRPRVLWAGIEAGPGLARLAAAIESALVPLGIPSETRDFRPHLTLARFGSLDGIDSLRNFVAETGAAEFGRAKSREFYLYQSILKHSGAEYTRLETFPMSREHTS